MRMDKRVLKQAEKKTLMCYLRVGVSSRRRRRRRRQESLANPSSSHHAGVRPR